MIWWRDGTGRPVLRPVPVVSVILPSYNHARFVRDAVISVLGQSLTELELIVVDDGSSDGTADEVAAIQDPALRLIRLPRNREVQPRNLALSLARGEFIAFQNSDDVWASTKLARQVAAMRAEPAIRLCFTATRIIGADGRPAPDTWAEGVFTTRNRPRLEWLRHFFDSGNCLAIASAMLRRKDAARLGGFRGSLVQLGDFDLWVRLAAIGEIAILPEVLCDVRVAAGVNYSAPSPASARRSHIELADVLARYAEPPLWDEIPAIFPELAGHATRGARMVALALRAWPRGGGCALFAERLVAQVMEDANARADAIGAHGAGFIHRFIAQRGGADVLPPGAAPA